MRLIDMILSDENIRESIKKVKSNKGAPGVDKMNVNELDRYMELNWNRIKQEILNKTYKPQLVRRVYISKDNGKKRPLGIPTVVDRVIQEAIARVLVRIYEPLFSDNSFGFRPRRSQHQAMERTLEYLNQGYEWFVDMDIEAYFDTVNHDKLISILRENVNDSTTLHLICKFLQAGILEGGLVKPPIKGMPQGGTLSPVLSNIYLDKFDKELESRGLRFVRFADDSNIFVKSERSADRVIKSVTSWLERKLFLKVSATKTKVVRSTNSNFLGFSYWKQKQEWKCRPNDKSKKRLYNKCRGELIRKKCAARPLWQTIKRMNEIVRGWINYFRIGNMKIFITKFGEWLRHKIRVIMMKQWKKPLKIFRCLMHYNIQQKCNIHAERIFAVANTRLGLYKQSNDDVVNFILSPKLLTQNTKEGKPGLVNPLSII